MASKSPVHTVASTRNSLKLLGELCRVGRIATISRATVMQFRAKRLASGASPATVNKDRRQIKSALSYAVDAGLLRANPLLRWKGLMLREPEKTVRVVEEAEFAKLVTKSGIASCTLHDLRRSFSTLAWRAGVDKYTVKDLGGWSAVSVVERHYTGDVSEAHRRAMKRIAETA